MNMRQTYETLRLQIEDILKPNDNFDIVIKPLRIQNIQMKLYMVDGFVKDEILEKVINFLLKADIQETVRNETPQDFCDKFITYVETNVEDNISNMVKAVLSGSVLLLVEGYQQAIIIDARTYPTRGMEEPEEDRTLRGSRDGFVETLIFNTALIRRRIRDPRLHMEYHSVGSSSQTDLVLCYMEDTVNQQVLEEIRHRLKNIQVKALTMSQESIAEALCPHSWMNPLPKVRYTERPDTAASSILEGKVILLIDNTPSALMLPTSFFDFVQETQDYYLPPITGNYLRLIRILVFFITLLVTPIWFHMNQNPHIVPSWLTFTLINKDMNIPIFLQLIILELGIDAIKLASLNTPSSLNSSFSIIGALILGDFAVNAGWLAPEIILYMAFVALANFTQASYELGYAVKFMRILLLVCIAVLPRYGFWIGIIFVLLIFIRTKTITKTSYLYPLYPLNLKDLKKIFIREKLNEHKHCEK